MRSYNDNVRKSPAPLGSKWQLLFTVTIKDMSFNPSRYCTIPACTPIAGDAVSVATGAADAVHANEPFALEQPLAFTSISKKRKAFGTKTYNLLPRFVSTPQLPGNTTMSKPDDNKKMRKKKNLGYTRISMACGRWEFPCRVRCYRLPPWHA